MPHSVSFETELNIDRQFYVGELPEIYLVGYLAMIMVLVTTSGKSVWTAAAASHGRAHNSAVVSGFN